MNRTPTDPLFQALANASTADLFWALGEILEPSHGGPFMNSYGGNDTVDTDEFVNALFPVIEAYRAAYDGCANVLDPDPSHTRETWHHSHDAYKIAWEMGA